jgi:hypothetical protein
VQMLGTSCGEHENTRTWKSLAAAGDQLAESLYTFASFSACVAYAERAGFINKTRNISALERQSCLRAQPTTDLPFCLSADAEHARSNVGVLIITLNGPKPHKPLRHPPAQASLR